MHDIKSIRKDPEKFAERLRTKGHSGDLAKLLSMDKERLNLLLKADELKNERNVVSRDIAEKKRNKEDASEQIAKMQTVAGQIKEFDERLNALIADINAFMFTLPNIPSDSAPIGADESENVDARSWGEKPEFDFPVKDHITLGQELGLFDFQRGAKIAGHGFPLYLGTGARLERALINFMLDLHVEKHGYKEVFPPFMANRKSTGGTGQLPKLEDDMYYCGEDDLFMIPTSEVPVTNIYQNEILNGEDLPINLTAYSACFRREAGSHGKDTRGFLRVHQFNKVEMVKFVDPLTSYDELESLVVNAEEVLQALGLHYRIIELCTGDLSFAAAKCYDIEVWSPGEEKYLEVSSCSNFEDFQARRIGIRFRRKKGEPVEYIHTLNGSGVATPRLLVAILEAYQTDEGTVVVPEALRPYMKTDVIK